MKSTTVSPPLSILVSPRPRVSASPWVSAALWLAIPAAVLAAYWPALHGGLLFDDDAHVTAYSLRSLHGLWRIWFDLGATEQYYPLIHSAFWIEHRLWGDAVLGYHLANVAQHSLVACLVVLIVRRLALPGAWLAGLIFALHPVCVETVAWICEQRATLSAVFYLAAALVYLRFDQSRRRSHYLWALALFICALLTKTVTATLPAALLVVLWWQRGRLDLRRDVRPLLAWFAIGIPAGLFTAWVERVYMHAQGPDFNLTPAQHILLPGRDLFFYASKVVWPANLIFTYPRWKIDPSVWWQWLFPLGVLVALAIAARCRAFLAGLLFFMGTLFPVLGFLNVYPLLWSWVADHFQYLACLGIIVPLAVVIAKVGQGHALARALSLFLLLTLANLTFSQSRMYVDAPTLDRATLARNPASWVAHNNLGVALAQDGRLSDATAEYRAALRLYPNDAPAHNNLGSLLARTPRQLPEAIAEYQTALRILPTLAEAHNNLAIALASLPGRLPDALTEHAVAISLKPDDPRMHTGLALTLSRVPGRLPEAISEFQAALRIDPRNAEAHDNLGNAWLRMPGHLPEAIAEYQTALLLKPDLAEARNNLGMALAQTPGRLPEAIAEFRAALRAQPDSVRAYISLGNTLAQAGRLHEAVAEYQAALRILPNDPEAHNNLGIALAQIPGRLPDAIAEYQAAVRLQPDRAEGHNNLGRALAGLPGRLPEAIAEYLAALAIQPDYLQARANLADALAKTPGRRADAIAQYQEVLRLRPNLESVRQTIARLQQAQR